MKSTLFNSTAGTKLGVREGLALFLLILLVVAVRSTLLALIEPFWYDEVITALICHLPSQSDISDALNHAADTMPPAFYLVERLARSAVPDDHLGYRLPSILGVLLTVSCIYVFLSKRVSYLSALVGATFALCTSLADFATDARPYGILLGCISVAIVAWQRIDDSRLYALLVSIALASAVSLHYYAILVWPSFLVAELSIWIFHCHFRVSAWASILAGALPLAFSAHLLLHLRQYYGANFWAQPSISGVFSAYDWLFNSSHHWGLSFAAGMIVVLLIIVFKKAGQAGLPGHRNVEPTGVSLPELILALMLLWLPMTAIAAAKVAQGGMSDRYMLPTVLGGAFAVGYVTEKLAVAGRALLLILFLVQYASVASITLTETVLHHSLLEERVNAAREVDAIVEQTRDPGLPIVIADNGEYLPTFYYTPTASKGKLYAISDPAADVKFSVGKSDSTDLTLGILRQYFPLQVADYPAFISTHREFLLVADQAEFDEWLPARLLYDGFTLTLLSNHVFAGSDMAVYKVAAKT